LLYVVGQLGLGGLERQLYYLLANLDHARYRPAVVVWNLNPHDKYYRDFEALKIPICGFPADWSPPSKLKALRTLAREIAPEVIHSYGFHTNFAAYYAAWGTGALAIGSLRGDFVRSKRGGGSFRGALNARWPVCHISNSVTSADGANRAGGLFTPKRVFVVRNALDLRCFKCASDISKKRDYVAAVGSLLPVKRWDRLLRVIRIVMDEGRKDVHVQIAGDGPLRPALEKLAGDLGISENVQFLGAISDVSAFLNGAKFLVHTSENEGCPNAVMEAMACGLPVVAMEAGDIPYLVEDGRTGFVVPQGDEMASTERVSQLLGNNELCVRMGLAACEKAKQEFTLERLISETLAVYRAAGWRDERVDDHSRASAGEHGHGACIKRISSNPQL
jgi:glycosyltransferase involved in cell wall biosynthesis